MRCDDDDDDILTDFYLYVVYYVKQTPALQKASKKSRASRKTRTVMVDVSGTGLGKKVAVLKSNRYSLNGGEESVFDR